MELGLQKPSVKADDPTLLDDFDPFVDEGRDNVETDKQVIMSTNRTSARRKRLICIATPIAIGGVVAGSLTAKGGNKTKNSTPQPLYPTMQPSPTPTMEPTITRAPLLPHFHHCQEIGMSN